MNNENVVKKDSNSILANCSSGGCGAKIDPTNLSRVLKKLPLHYDDNLIVGYNSSDDASIYKINDSQAILNTTDFFSPMVDDPFLFGKIAAANALSDVYAMGGTPITALNIVCFPQAMDIDILEQILIGGATKVKEANASLSGGHSIYDKEVKYGLAVTGIVNPNKILLNNTPCVGDVLILTKPLGVGICMAAHKVGLLSEDAYLKVTRSMERLNKDAASKMDKYCVNACTDITGFGLLAHTIEMVSDKYCAVFDIERIPYFKEAYSLACDYVITSAAQRNRNHIGSKVNVSSLDFGLQEILLDPQTSGGLLISVCKEDSQALLNDIKEDDPSACIIGHIEVLNDEIISFR